LVDGEINNNHRFLSAAEALFRQYSEYLLSKGRYEEGKRPSWDELEKSLVEAIGPVWSGDENYDHQDRIETYQQMAPWLPEFDETTWFYEAIESETRGLRDAHGGFLSYVTIFKDKHYWRRDVDPKTTHWRNFQTSVKQHEKFALDLLTPYFSQIGVKLSAV
jgi:hypothetical protein